MKPLTELLSPEGLGLVADDVDREKEDREEWVQESGPYTLVRYRKAGEGGGLLLRHRDTGVVYRSEDLAAVVNYAPEGVLTGKRQRWRRPGARDGPGPGDGPVPTPPLGCQSLKTFTNSRTSAPPL